MGVIPFGALLWSKLRRKLRPIWLTVAEAESSPLVLEKLLQGAPVESVGGMAVGAVPAGIYTTCSPVEVRYIVAHAEAPIILIEDEGQWRKVQAEMAAARSATAESRVKMATVAKT